MIKIIIAVLLLTSSVNAALINAEGAHDISDFQSKKVSIERHSEEWEYVVTSIGHAISIGHYSVNVNYNLKEYPEIANKLKDFGYKLKIISPSLLEVNW